jgi:hypothetical protein
MSAAQRRSTAEEDLSERQQYWLKHLRTADRKGEPLTAYAERLGLAKSSLYEAKRRLRALGVISSVPERTTSSPDFVRVERRFPTTRSTTASTLGETRTNGG